MDEQKWTSQMVADRLEEAANTIKRLPKVSPKGYTSSWPTMIQESLDNDLTDVVLRLGPPPPDAISRMDETLQWLRWLEPNDMRLVWSRAVGIPWKYIAAKAGVCRRTAYSKWAAAVKMLAYSLNAGVA